MNVPGRILVVDDDEQTRTLCAAALSLAGYEVKKAPGAFAALDLLGEARYGLVVTDLEMPGLDGIALYMRVLKEYSYLSGRFLFMTGNTTEEARRALDLLGLGCITKPFKVAELVGAVNTLMDRPAERAMEEQRSGERWRWRSECTVIELRAGGPRSLSAKTRDISSAGLGIEHDGEPLLPLSSVNVFLTAGSSSVNRVAQVVWSSASGAGCSAGLRFAEPVPAASIMSGV